MKQIDGLIHPSSVRRMLQQIGPTFIKVGQFLALRPDFVPPEYCDEFLKLTDHVEQFPYSDVRQIIEEDLGSPPEALFHSMNPHPLAAGSLAQVHLARTLDGDEVAVKVQRPGIEETVNRDLRRAQAFTRFLELIGATTISSPAEVLDEVSRWMREELDLGLELRNLTRLYELSGQLTKARIPRPYPELSKGRVLVAEYLGGVPLSDVLRRVRAGELQRLEDQGVDRARLAENLLDTVLAQIFRCRFFHADTHPGNLIAMPDNTVGFVDFGLADTLDPTFDRGMLSYLSAVYSNDVDAMFRGLTELLIPSDSTDIEQFRAEFIDQSRRWQRDRQIARPGVPGQDSPVGRYLVGVLRAARQHQLKVPPAVLSMYRALLTAETLAAQLGGEVDLASVGKKFFSQLQVERVIGLLHPDQLRPLALQSLNLIIDGPGQVQHVLDDLVANRLELKVRVVESPTQHRQANYRAVLIAASILSVGTAFLIGSSGDQLLFGTLRLAHVLWIQLIVLWVGAFVLWRRLR